MIKRSLQPVGDVAREAGMGKPAVFFVHLTGVEIFGVAALRGLGGGTPGRGLMDTGGE